MKKFYLSFVTICLIFSATAPLPVTVYAETNSPEEISPNNTEEKPTQEGSTTSSNETNEKKPATADKTNEETTNASNTAADTSSPEKETTPDTKTTSPSPKEKAATNQLLAAGDTYIDTFPDEAFAKVIALQITGNDDTSQVVTQEQLDSITSLNASGKNITDVTGINQLTNLTSIDLSQNQLTSIAPITDLTSLTSLNVSNNLLSIVVITTAQNIPNLTSLNISNNPTITKLSIADQAKLTSFSAALGGSQTSALEELTLSNLPALTTAGTSSPNSVYFSNYSDVLTTVKLNGLPKIQRAIFDNNLIDDIDVHDMAGLTTLELHANELTDINKLADLPMLNYLNASSNQLTTAGIANVVQLDALQTLYLDSNLLTSFTLDAENDLPNLTNLSISSMPTITNIHIADQAKLTSFSASLGGSQTSALEELTLSNLPALTTAGTSSPNSVYFSNYSDVLTTVKLNGLPKIQRAIFDNNLIDEVDVHDMDALTTLELHANELTDINKLADLPMLNYLNASSNQLTNAGIANVVQLDALQTLYLDSNLLTSFTLDAENDLPNLTNLSISSMPAITNIHIADQAKLTSFSASLGGRQSALEELTLSNLPALTTAGTSSPNSVYFSNYSDVLTTVKLNGLPKIQRAIFDNNLIDDIDVHDMAGLTTLELHANELTDINKLADLPMLNYLNASSNQLTNAGIANVVQLDALQTLYLDSNLLTSFTLDAENDLPNLTNLSISSMPTITNIHIADQAKLTSFSASLGGRQSALEELTLSNLPALTTAGTSSPNSVSFSNYSDVLTTVKLNGLPKIQRAIFDNNLIDEVDVHDMDALTTLDLHANELTDINNLQDVPLLNNINVNNNHIAVLPANLETQVPNLKTLSAGSQTISLPTQIVSGDLSVANGISNNGVISAPTTISNSGVYQDGNVNWVYDDIKNLSSVSYNFSEPVNYSGVVGTFSGTVTQPIKVSLAPVITAEDSITYPKFSTVTEAEFLTDIQASTSDDSSITSDFGTVVDFSTPGDYTVTLNSENEDGVPANPVTVTVTVEKAPAPIITADSEITYMKHSTITSAEFLTGIHATTNDGSPITSDFETVVDFETAGDYTVTLQSVNSDGIAATPVTVTVHVEKAPAPIITADSEISYAKNSTIDSQQFYNDIHASTSDGSPITSDFDAVVDFTTPGDYTVTLNSVNEDGIAASPITVVVHVEKTPAPIITADSEISYAKNSTIDSQQFYNDIHASTSDDSPITSDFETVVDFTTPGDYTVTLNSVNSDGVAADPVSVTVHVSKDPAPIISADSEITYSKHSNISPAEFLTAIHATTNDGSPITSNFETVVNFEKAGDYTITLQSMNSDGVLATPVTVIVHIAKDPAPIITADSEISYKINSKVDLQQFYKDVHATTNDGSPITSNFKTAVNFAVTGDYTVTLQAKNSDGVAAEPVKVIVHITANEPTPTPPDNNGNSSNSGNNRNSGNSDNNSSNGAGNGTANNSNKEGQQTNNSLPDTGDTNNSLVGIFFLLIAFSIFRTAKKKVK
ncbi:LapB repeat-containing protein [Listeria seeligeri]|uniref:LapB repeat-containing protein n=1 Tax=Listeria seeligeri TaxID=1640 RepID=UPI0018884A90|nr:LapB repeat-containing protein [Listeria seeligeri]MBF2449240.1 LapB repeat-containing protein [Listeria seeligeri]